MTDLAGATQRPQEGATYASPGEFAARWNAMTPERRQAWFDNWTHNARTAYDCFVQMHTDEIHHLRERNAYLEARESVYNDILARITATKEPA